MIKEDWKEKHRDDFKVEVYQVKEVREAEIVGAKALKHERTLWNEG